MTEQHRAAIAANPKDWSARVALAQELRAAGDLEAAEREFAHAVALNPDIAAQLIDFAASQLAAGRANEALEAVATALAARSEPGAHALFVQCVRAANRLPAVPAFPRLMIRALREAWGRPIDLTDAALVIVKSEPRVAAATRAAMTAWPRRLAPADCAPLVKVLAADDLLRAVLDTALVNDPELERLLTSVRAALLDFAVRATGEVARELVPFVASLARQCFTNEYVFDVSDPERQAVAWLRTRVRLALADRSRVLAMHLFALASYAPLHTLERDDALTGRKWLPAVNDLITEQVREPKAEAALRAAMPRLTEIAGAVSEKVRQQYEENPYPRWVRGAPTPPETGILAHLRGIFPDAPLPEIPEPDPLNILIAGCGTGQQPIEAAQRFPRARVLAIDLSLASLGYAKRKSDALRLSIEYGQADIVGLTLPGRTFDIVEASGVLHHLAEPMVGWRTLLDLLKPRGFMRLGFYSELGRAGVVAIRQMIAERGYSATPDDIRRCRQEIISRREPRLAAVLRSPDFYSTSACRDFLFHVQEHRLTLPQIAAFLGENRLAFLGFLLGTPVRAKYLARFPDDPDMTDLANWHLFESDNPDTFAGMYQFWVQKAQ